MRRFSLTISAVLAVTLLFADLAAATEVDDAIATALAQAEDGRCDEAYQSIAQVDGLEDRARLLAGRCRLGQGLYPEALDDLNRIRAGSDLSDEQIGDVELYRGVAFYHLDRFAESAAALGRAEGETTQEAQFALYQGLIDLRNGQFDRATPLLEKAARLSPAETEPIASFYAGQAWHGAAERTKARAAFQRVVHIDGDGPWGLEAAKMLESTELFPYFVRMSAGIEYDDNVILQGGLTQFVAPGSGLQITNDGEKDWRGVWRLDTGVQLFNANDWSGGVSGGYSGNAHFDLADFNTHFPTVGAYLAHRLGPNTTAQVRYQFGFAWVDEDSLLSAHVGEIGLAHTWPKAGTTIVVADVVSNDYRFTPDGVLDEGAGGTCVSVIGGCGPIGLREERERERDGVGFGGAVDHQYPIPVPDVVDEFVESIDLGGGYRFRYYNAEGNEWEHMAHIFSARLIFEFPHAIRVSTLASYELRDFANPSTFPDNEIVGTSYVPLASQDREEHEVTFQAEIAKDLNEHFSVSARWSFLDNESNRRVYDYTRHIVGAYVNFRFD